MSQVISNLGILPEDRIIAIKENENSNSSFVISSILGQCISDKQNICLVLTQNTLGHFHLVGKRLGYDFAAYIQDGKARKIDFLKEIDNAITKMDMNACVRHLFNDVVKNVKALSESGPTTVIFDDISHLLDIGIPINDVLMYVKVCTAMAMMRNVRVVISCHVASDENDSFNNLIFHSADIWVTVSALKTGISRNVTGSMLVKRLNMQKEAERFYHYKLEDKDIKVFYPGKDL